MTDKNERERELHAQLADYASRQGYRLNPDTALVERVIRGMVMIEQKKGKPYCPCRLVTGKPELDSKIVCPCEFHAAEIAKDGMCHCQLLVKK